MLVDIVDTVALVTVKATPRLRGNQSWLVPGYTGVSGYLGVSAGVHRGKCRGTKGLVPGYEGVSAGVRRG